MRSLRTSDLFNAGRMIFKIGVRKEIEEVVRRAEETKANKTKIDLSFDLFFGILEKAMQKNAEKEIYIFIADIFECDWEEVRDMDPIELFDKLEQVADFEKWKSFFKRAARLTQMK